MKKSFLFIVIMSLVLCACTPAPQPRQAQSSFICASAQSCAVVSNRLITADRGSVKCFDLSGNVEFERELEQADAVISASGDNAAAYCVGGKTVVLSSGDTIETENDITSVSASESGMTAVCTLCAGYEGLVTVYSPDAEPVYRWYSANAAIAAAQVSPNGEYLAVLTADEIHIFSLDSEEKRGLYKAPEAMHTLCWTDDNVCGIADTGVYFCDDEGDSEGACRLTGLTTAIYAVLDDKLIIQLSDARGEETAYIIDGGDIRSSVSVEGQILGIHCRGDEILILTQDTVGIYSDSAQPLSSMNAAGAEAAFLLSGGRVLTVGGGTAQILKP